MKIYCLEPPIIIFGILFPYLFFWPLPWARGFPLPGWARVISYVSPVTYLADLMRFVFGQSHFFPVSVNLVIFTGFTILLLMAALWFHQKTIPWTI